MQRKYKGNTKEIHRKYKGNTKEIQRKCKGNTEETLLTKSRMIDSEVNLALPTGSRTQVGGFIS